MGISTLEYKHFVDRYILTLFSFVYFRSNAFGFIMELFLGLFVVNEIEVVAFSASLILHFNSVLDLQREI